MQELLCISGRKWPSGEDQSQVTGLEKRRLSRRRRHSPRGEAERMTDVPAGVGRAREQVQSPGP